MTRPRKHTVSFHSALRDVRLRAAPVPVQTQAKPVKRPAAPSPPPVAVSDETTESRTHAEVLALIKKIDSRIESIQQQSAEYARQVRGIAVELSVAIASHLAGQKIDAGEFDIESFVSEATAQLLPAERIEVRMHPEDAELVRTVQEAGSQFGENMVLMQDRKLCRGAISVSDGRRTWFASLEDRLESIRDALLQEDPE